MLFVSLLIILFSSTVLIQSNPMGLVVYTPNHPKRHAVCRIVHFYLFADDKGTLLLLVIAFPIVRGCQLTAMSKQHMLM